MLLVMLPRVVTALERTMVAALLSRMKSVVRSMAEMEEQEEEVRKCKEGAQMVTSRKKLMKKLMKKKTTTQKTRRERREPTRKKEERSRKVDERGLSILVKKAMMEKQKARKRMQLESEREMSVRQVEKVESHRTDQDRAK